MIECSAYRVAVVGGCLTTADLRAGVGLRAAPGLAGRVVDGVGVDGEVAAGGGVVLGAGEGGEGRYGDGEGGVEHVGGIDL